VERGAVNLRSEAEPWSGLERKGRGSEHGAGLGSAARGAAQAGLTEGAERSSRLRHETNVQWWNDQPKAVPNGLVWVEGSEAAALRAGTGPLGGVAEDRKTGSVVCGLAGARGGSPIGAKLKQVG
jgi:hypothetical protein